MLLNLEFVVSGSPEISLEIYFYEKRIIRKEFLSMYAVFYLFCAKVAFLLYRQSENFAF